MNRTGNNYLIKHRKFRTDKKKLAMFFLISAIVVSTIVFWWLKLIGITVTGDAFCGLDEHIHDDNCYTSELICTYDETTSVYEEGETSLSAAADEVTYISEESGKESQQTVTEKSHVHIEDCYKKTLTCTKTEHTHTKECLPNRAADVETVSDWMSTFENVEITNNIPENLVAIAMSQIGYEESCNNF